MFWKESVVSKIAAFSVVIEITILLCWFGKRTMYLRLLKKARVVLFVQGGLNKK